MEHGFSQLKITSRAPIQISNCTFYGQFLRYLNEIGQVVFLCWLLDQQNNDNKQTERYLKPFFWGSGCLPHKFFTVFFTMTILYLNIVRSIRECKSCRVFNTLLCIDNCTTSKLQAQTTLKKCQLLNG